jgi:hypothetical protein
MRRCAGAALMVLLVASPPALAVEITRGPLVQSPGPGTWVVAWETDVPAVGRVVYGTGASLDRQAEAVGVAARHEVRLEGLAAGADVSYRVLAGTSHSRLHRFVLPPADGGPVEFLVFGDNRSTHLHHRAVIEAMVPRACHFLVNTGDLVNRGNLLEDWNVFFAVERPLLASTLSFHVVGNHDRIGGSTELFEAFLVQPSSPHAPERDYTVDLGCVRLVVLDNAVTSSDAKVQRAWLEKVLVEGESLTHIRHVVVAVHQGVHSNGPHGPSASLLAAGLDDVMRAHGVALVVAGHDHGYERGVVDGLRYMVSGGGGAPVYTKTVNRGHALARHAVHHFVHVKASEDSIGFEVVLKDGTVLESCTMPPGQGFSCQ